MVAEFEAAATVFVCPGMLGEPHPSFHRDAGVRLMTAEELRRLADFDSIEIGSHTRRHTNLGEADAGQAYEEMVASKHELEELIGRTVSSFAYPYCSYSRACPEAAKRAGYKVAVTCAPRGGWRRYELYRESAKVARGQARLRAQVQGAVATSSRLRAGAPRPHARPTPPPSSMTVDP